MFFKNEKEKCFAYLAHTACDNNNFIVDFHITPGNIHDSVAFSDLYQKIKNKHTKYLTGGRLWKSQLEMTMQQQKWNFR